MAADNTGTGQAVEIRHCKHADPAGNAPVQALGEEGCPGELLVAWGPHCNYRFRAVKGAEGTRGLANSWWEQEAAFPEMQLCAVLAVTVCPALSSTAS